MKNHLHLTINTIGQNTGNCRHHHYHHHLHHHD